MSMHLLIHILISQNLKKKMFSQRFQKLIHKWGWCLRIFLVDYRISDLPRVLSGTCVRMMTMNGC